MPNVGEATDTPETGTGDVLGPKVVGWRQARDLVLRYGWNATAYQILNPGIDLWFAAAGDAVVGYVSRSGVRVVAGAPVTAAERLAAVATEFERDAAVRGERVCYFCAEDRLETLFRDAADRSMVSLGAQPVWHPSGWASVIAGKSSLRAQLHRARNKGVAIAEWPPEQAGNAPELRECLHDWLAVKGLPPLHFLVEPDTLGHLADRRTFVAIRDGRTVGFLVASPVPARHGWLIEQIVRSPSAPNGTAELLLDDAVRALATAGSRYLTLGLAPLSRRGSRTPSENPLWLRVVLGWVRAHGRRFYNFEGLEAFKAKFEPTRWDPVYAVANERPFSPAMLHAVAAAFGGGSPALLVARAVLKAARDEANWLLSRVRL